MIDLRTWILTALTTLLSFPATANLDDRLERYLAMSLEELMELTITISTSTPQSLARAPAVVTVITAEDIRATSAGNLAELLQSVPGIYVRASHFGYRPLIHFRGGNANQTLLMVNGSPMKDLTWGFGIFWKGLPASIIDRIEIIRGPGSALFGSDASGGVINVITKSAVGVNHSEIGLRHGSFDTSALSFQHGDHWAGFDLTLTGELSRTNGHAPLIQSDAQSLYDQQTGNSSSYAPARARYDWQNHDLRLSLAHGAWRVLGDYTRHRDLAIGLTGGGLLDPTTRASDYRRSLQLRHDQEQLNDHWGLHAEFGYLDLGYHSGNGFQERPPGHQVGTTLYPHGVINQMIAHERRWNGELSTHYRGFNSHSLRLGGGYIWQAPTRVEHRTSDPQNPLQLNDHSGTAAAFIPQHRREVYYLFLQDIWKINERWELTSGARYDRYSDFGGTFNPRLALVWQTTPQLNTKLLYGQAFRAPSYYELYAPTSHSQPNPHLQPERSETWELAFGYTPMRNLRLGLNLYHFVQQDLIAPAQGRFANTGQHTTRGLELETQWQASEALRLAASYSAHYQEQSPYRSLFVPQRTLYLRSDWSLSPAWNWNLQLNWSGPRPRSEHDPRPTLAANGLLDTTLRYAPNNRWEFAATIRNLLDQDAREFTGRAIPNDLPLPGRNVYAELRYRF